MGEARKDALRVGFDRAIKLEFHGAKVSSDAGLFPYRDLDDAARLTESPVIRMGNSIVTTISGSVTTIWFSAPGRECRLDGIGLDC